MSFRNTEPTTTTATNQETAKSTSSTASVSTKPSSSSSSHITSSPDTKHEKLINTAILNGFNREEAEQGLAEFTADNAASADILDYAFLEYLKMNKKFNYSQQANIDKNLNSLFSGKKKKKKPALKVPMQTNSATPSLQGVEPASKKLNVEANLNDSDECLCIDYVPSANTNSSAAKPSTSSSAQTNKAKSSEKVLSEYAKMVQGQEFNQENEKLDKPMRLSKLISAMPDNQKLTALHHVNTYRTANSNTNSNNINTNNNNNGATFSNEKINGNNQRTANFNYDPTVYQDNHIDSFNILFTNFSENRKNTDLKQNNQQQQQQQQQNQKPFEVTKATFKPPIFSNLNNENLQNRILKTEHIFNNNNSRRSRFNRRKNNHTSVERNSQFKSRSKSKNQRFSSCDKPLSGINNNFNQFNNRNNNNNNNLKNGQKFNAVPFPFEHVKSTIKVSEYELIIFFKSSLISVYI
jgi:hypothetical protein